MLLFTHSFQELDEMIILLQNPASLYEIWSMKTQWFLVWVDCTFLWRIYNNLITPKAHIYMPYVNWYLKSCIFNHQ